MGLGMQSREVELPDSVHSVCKTATADINKYKCYSSPPPGNHTNRKTEEFSILCYSFGINHALCQVTEGRIFVNTMCRRMMMMGLVLLVWIKSVLHPDHYMYIFWGFLQHRNRIQIHGEPNSSDSHSHFINDLSLTLFLHSRITHNS